MRLKLNSRLGLQSPQSSARGIYISKNSQVLVGRRPQFLTVCWLDTPVPCHVGLFIDCPRLLVIWQLVAPRASIMCNVCERERGNVPGASLLQHNLRSCTLACLLDSVVHCVCVCVELHTHMNTRRQES